MPGLAVGFVGSDGIAHSAVVGLADVAARRPVDADTSFRIGSVSKLFTALAVMRCVHGADVGLDDPVTDHIRAFSVTGPGGNGRGPTVRQLLTHTGGFGEWVATSDLWRRPARLATGVPRGRRMPTLAELYAPTVATAGVPGAEWAYSNHGYAVLGQLVEDVTETPFATFVEQSVARPMGMTRTLVDRTSAVDGTLAVGYRPGSSRPAPFFDVLVSGAGGVYSTPADLLRFVSVLAGHAGDDVSVASPRLLREMWEPQHSVHPALPGIGLTFIIDRQSGFRTVAHGGSVPGFGTSVIVAPDAGIGVFVCTNENATSPIVNKAEIVGATLLDDLLASCADPVDPADQHDRVVGPVSDGAQGLGRTVPLGRWSVPKDPRLHARAWQHHGGEITVTDAGDGAIVVRSATGALRHGVRCEPIAASDLAWSGRAAPGAVTAAFVPGDTASQDALYLNGAPIPLRFRRATGPPFRTRATVAVGGAIVASASAGFLARRVLSRR